MSNELFSERHGFRARRTEVIYKDAPFYIRDDFKEILSEVIKTHRVADTVPSQLEWRIRRAFGRHVRRQLPDNPMFGPSSHINKIIDECKWDEFYDLCELAYQAIEKEDSTAEAQGFASQINMAFQRENVAWQFSNGLIELARPEPIAKKIEEARILLQDPKFQGADTMFGKALGHLNKRPEPDVENCVKDAVGSVESVARVIVGDDKALLSDFLGKEAYRSGIHPALIEVIKKLYGYRGDVGGVAHGLVGPPMVGHEEANFVLTICAGAIIYLVTKFSSPNEQTK